MRARRVGHLPQDVVFARPERSAAEVYDAATGSAVPLRELGLLHPRELSRPVGVLSTGQQRRLGLAILVARKPDLLLLDEPTNHISLALADELEESLRHSSGTVAGRQPRPLAAPALVRGDLAPASQGPPERAIQPTCSTCTRTRNGGRGCTDGHPDCGMAGGRAEREPGR